MSNVYQSDEEGNERNYWNWPQRRDDDGTYDRENRWRSGSVRVYDTREGRKLNENVGTCGIFRLRQPIASRATIWWQCIMDGRRWDKPMICWRLLLYLDASVTERLIPGTTNSLLFNVRLSLHRTYKKIYFCQKSRWYYNGVWRECTKL